MTIKENLPFEQCQNCEHFVLDVNEQVIFSNGLSERILMVGCKNAWLCKQLSENLNKDGDQSEKPM